ncbi:MAG: GNAT family N-acetyltransferase [Actinomycetota bacterium]
MPSQIPIPNLADGEISLRPWVAGDVPALSEALSDPDVSLWIPVIPYPYSEDDARSFIELAGREPGRGRGLHLAVTEGAGGRILGNVSLAPVSLANRTGAVGYWIVRDARGRGLGTRAVRLVVDWGFDRLGLERIELVSDIDNVTSRAIARRLGFSEEGVLRSYSESRRGRRDSVMYSLLRAERGSRAARPGLPARLNLVTLGVREPQAMRAFFERLGWPVWVTAEDGFTGYLTGGAMLALYPLDKLAEDSRAEAISGGWSGVTLAVNVESRALVDTAIEAARAAGAEIVKEPADAEWGGRSGYFADPEGNRFEVAWMPGSSFDARGALIVPRMEG